MTVVPDDQPARDRIRADLSTTMLVEAGAGSGKTTALVGRMLEHVRTGTPAERLAAVTFTRKAANELRERLQIGLERAVRDASEHDVERARYERALRELDRCFVGTIHAFCARLLRERPIEIGLDPAFRELSEEETSDLRRRFWRQWVERARRDGASDVAALASIGVEPRVLADAFEMLVTYPDVDFPHPEQKAPDITRCRRRIEELMRATRSLMPAREPEAGWDALMQLVRRLEFRRRVEDWSDRGQFCNTAEGIKASACAVVQQRWAGGRGRSPEAKELSEQWTALVEGDLAELLRRWHEFRYPYVMRVLLRAARDFEHARQATGQLDFEDLLLMAARLLREQPAVRRELGARYTQLLIDEFQDTDPVQAEVCLLLASDPAQGDDWRRVLPRAGSLFVVGDPKQSIYRFRRADIQVYEFVKQRIAQCGAVLALTANFRSMDGIAALVNEHFSRTFPTEASAEQAPFRPMNTRCAGAPPDGVYHYCLESQGKVAADRVIRDDAERVASWIARRIQAGKRRAGDFMILTAAKWPIAYYARALAERDVPVSTTGATLPQEHELRELLVLLRALADPENPVQVVAALEGLFFGLSPADLWEAHRRGTRFALTHPPADEEHAAGRALRQLHEWWKLSQRHAVDVLLDRMLDETGMLLYAASGELGDARAGALLHLVESLRASELVRGGAITDATEWLDTLLAADSPDAPLRPGRADAVRVMNLHKAKGLEADVVILAAPLDESSHDPVMHVQRGESGNPLGSVRIVHTSGRETRVLAQPAGWAESSATELRFAAAERERLLYVAATRAKRELVVAQRKTQLKSGASEDDAMWRPLAPVLERLATLLQLEPGPAPGRRRLERTAESLRGAVNEAHDRRVAAGTPSLAVRTVTELAKQEAPDGTVFPSGGGAGAGAAWGSAVHRCIAGLLRGRRGAALADFARAVAREEGLAEGEAERLVRVLPEVASTPGWSRLVAAGEPQAELSIMRCTDRDGRADLTEGVIDAAVLGSGGWRVVDWKTDAVDDATWAERLRQYSRQTDEYAAMLESVSGRPATAEIQRVLEGAEPGGARSGAAGAS